ncbi:MAG: Zn-dependent membrane protease YugP [Pseudohongiellaceae bacterium]|jgi:Zn-dependent membrane protease YugP
MHFLTMFDPIYWIFLGIGMAVSLWANMRVKGAFAKYSKLGTSSHMTGADIARAILRDHGITDVTVEPIAGKLTDHYDPRSRTLRLSEPVYGKNSMAAFGIAAHEVGHAIQHADNYGMLGFRSAWVPVANIGSGLSIFLIMGAMFLGGIGTALGATLAWAGIALFATTTIFTLITLPVEFDASRRALLCLEGGNYVNEEELQGARTVLSAAAMTYVAAFITSLLMLIYYAMRLGLFGGRSND